MTFNEFFGQLTEEQLHQMAQAVGFDFNIFTFHSNEFMFSGSFETTEYIQFAPNRFRQDFKKVYGTISNFAITSFNTEIVTYIYNKAGVRVSCIPNSSYSYTAEEIKKLNAKFNAFMNTIPGYKQLILQTAITVQKQTVDELAEKTEILEQQLRESQHQLATAANTLSDLVNYTINENSELNIFELTKNFPNSAEQEDADQSGDE